MKTLADELMEVLPQLFDAHPQGVTLKAAADWLGADAAHVRPAFDAVAARGIARLLRKGRGGGLHLVGHEFEGKICIICHREFTPVAKQTRTCSHSCARHLAWQNPDMRKRHRESVRRSLQRPDVKKKITEKNRRFSRTPEERARRAECNRKSWGDMESRARRLKSITEAWESKERRKLARQRKLRQWADPEFRKKAIEGMRTGKRGQRKRRALELAKLHPHMTAAEIAESVGQNLPIVERTLRCARQSGEIGIRPGNGPRIRRRQAEATA